MPSSFRIRERPRLELKADVADNRALNAADSLRLHWPEYLMEAGELGLYLVSACTVATVLWHPASPVQRYLPGDAVRRMLMGSAMGATIVAIVLSPWGKQSGAHFNPAVTFTFYRLGNVAFWDAVFYCAAQFLGAVAAWRSPRLCSKARRWIKRSITLQPCQACTGTRLHLRLRSPFHSS